MKKIAVTLFFMLSISFGFAQTKIWQVELSPFFDNTEFGKSTVTHDQTMAGTRLTPSVGLAFDSVHRVMAGITLLQEFGSKNVIDTYAPIVYYAYNSKPVEFCIGAFPRKYAVENYSRVFFQDSINFYRPIMNGLTCKIYKNNSYLNVWLDWTGRQTTTQRETFFVGLSGRLQKGILYFQHYDYMMHYAKMLNPPPGQFIHDNGLFLTSVGIDLTKKTKLNKLDINAGWLCGLEDNRGTTGWLTHNGLMIDATIEYKFIGVKNTFYKGAQQQYFYGDEGNKLYWGDPFYRLSSYNRTDIFIKFFQSKKLNAKFVYSLHAAEEKLYHEQALYVTVDLNNYLPKTKN